MEVSKARDGTGLLLMWNSQTSFGLLSSPYSPIFLLGAYSVKPVPISAASLQ